MNNTAGFVGSFREAAPYIQYLRGKTLVVGVSDSLLGGDTLASLAADFNLLSSLGIRLVVVHGSRTTINTLAQVHGITPRYCNHRRITDETFLQYAKQASGILRSDIEAALYSSVSQTLRRSNPPVVAGGSFLAAKPIGVIDGVDMGYTGLVRKIDTDAVNRLLDGGAVVLISPLGYSFSGKTFNLSMGETAEAAAVALKAEKLVYIIEQEGILDADGFLITNLSADEARQRIEAGTVHPQQRRLLSSAVKAVENGIVRTQILSGRRDGSLIRELFTRDGAGTSVAQNPFAAIRKARNSDIPYLMEMIKPLAEQGILLRRSREHLENHIGSFSVPVYDRRICGCIALKTFDDPDSAELACLVVSPDARDGGYGEMLLEHLFQKARSLHIRRLFALSTHTGEWFAERGFQTASPEDLPPERFRDYIESGRNSRVFVYDLN